MSFTSLRTPSRSVAIAVAIISQLIAGPSAFGWSEMPGEVVALVRLIDVTGDGKPDKISLGSEGEVTVAIHTGGQTYETVRQTLPLVHVSNILSADLNRDGLTDLYLVSSTNNVALVGDGAGGFFDATEDLGLADGGWGVSAEQLDADDDGLPDLLLHNHAGDVLFWSRPNGGYDLAWKQSASGLSPSAQKLAEFLASASAAGSNAHDVFVLFSIQTVLDAYDFFYINDGLDEVDTNDILDGSLQGPDVSTSVGDVTHVGGNVGLGTSTPAAQLDVAGDVAINGAVVINAGGEWIGNPAGLQGPVGPTGPAGADGADGAQGPTGLTGPAGAAGADGVDGAQGPMGLTGPAGAAGADGVDGAQGPMGLTGPAGAAGADGADGAQGPVGLTGPAGAAGADGVDGAQGPMGLTGPAGAAGADGVDGAQGPIGLTGPAGAAGADGAQGPMGLTGPAGADGADGAQGPIGLTGPAGAAGADGVDGAQGPVGLTGPAGAAGADGVDGAQGPVGLTGPAGAAGADGVDGAQGPMGLTGPAGPAGADGVDGAQGPIGLTGPAGAAGADGAQGPMGLTGPAGAAGADGVDGAQGPIGLTGPAGAAGADGADGAQGPTGLTGPAGADGADGAQGPVGLTGPAGAAGADGVDGAQGPIGLTGPAGAAGADGVDGAQGPMGLTGPAGADGSDGPQGPIGMTGPAGADGLDGAQGPAGADGMDGAQGPAGPAGVSFVRTALVVGDGSDAANGLALLSALSGITASAADPWVLKLEPGIYDLGGAQLVLQPFIDLEGSGETVTRIKGSRNLSGVVLGANDSQTRLLTIEGEGLGTPICFQAANTSPSLSQVTLFANATGSARGLQHSGNASVDLDRVTVDVRGPSTVFGIYGTPGSGLAAELRVHDSSVKVTNTGGGLASGILYSGTGRQVISDSRIESISSSASGVYGVRQFNVAATTEISNSLILSRLVGLSDNFGGTIRASNCLIDAPTELEQLGGGILSTFDCLDELGQAVGDNRGWSRTGAIVSLTDVGDTVGIGTGAPTFTLEVNGTAGKPGGGSWSNSSDRRLKKNIADMEGVLDRLLKLRGVTYEYIDPEAIRELPGTRLGMIAQEVEEVFPDWVHTADGYKRLTYRGFEALTVEALRELRQEKDDEIAELQEQLDALTRRLDSLPWAGDTP